MIFNERNLIVAESLDGIFSDEMTGYITHAYCTTGSCAIVYNGERLTFGRGDLMILLFNRMVTAVEPSEDFSVRAIFIHLQFLEACTPHTSYGVAGGLTMYLHPILHLNGREQHICEDDFRQVARRIRDPHEHFQGDAMMAVTQMMFIDFYEFHARQNPQSEVSALTASVMRRFIDLLERGDYRKNREVGYYADLLCVTPKYLSEVCKKVSGFSANFWIDRFAVIELTRLLRDKSLSLTDISDLFGFTSQSHFSRYVQKNLGTSPSTFRA